MRSASEWMPLRLNEGLAEFYENTDIQEKEVMLGQANANLVSLLLMTRLRCTTQGTLQRPIKRTC
jgi:hypothetical protein